MRPAPRSRRSSLPCAGLEQSGLPSGTVYGGISDPAKDLLAATESRSPKSLGFTGDFESGMQTRKAMGSGWVVGRVLETERSTSAAGAPRNQGQPRQAASLPMSTARRADRAALGRASNIAGRRLSGDAKSGCIAEASSAWAGRILEQGRRSPPSQTAARRHLNLRIRKALRPSARDRSRLAGPDFSRRRTGPSARQMF